MFSVYHLESTINNKKHAVKKFKIYFFAILFILMYPINHILNINSNNNQPTYYFVFKFLVKTIIITSYLLFYWLIIVLKDRHIDNFLHGFKGGK